MTANEGEIWNEWLHQKEFYEKYEKLKDEGDKIWATLMYFGGDNCKNSDIMAADWTPGGFTVILKLEGRNCLWGDKIINGGNYVVVDW